MGALQVKLRDVDIKWRAAEGLVGAARGVAAALRAEVAVAQVWRTFCLHAEGDTAFWANLIWNLV